MSLGGAEDEEIRKKGKETLLYILDLSKNALMILDTLFYQGISTVKQGCKTKAA